MEGPISFHGLSADSFPFEIKAWDADTGDVLWTTTVEGPSAVKVPGKPEGIRQVKVTFTWPDGTTQTQ